MQILNTSSSISSLTLDRLALYSGLDVLTLFEIKDGLMSLMDPNRMAVYNFEMELQAPLLSMSFVGIPVDESARREMVTQFTQEQTHLTALINRMLQAIGYFDYYRDMAVKEFSACVDYTPLPLTWDEWLQLPIGTRRVLKDSAPEALVKFQKALKEYSEPFNPVSPSQKLKLFYHFFGSPANTTAEPYFFQPPWLKTHGIPEHKSRNVKGDYTPAVDREALEKIIKTAGDEKMAATLAAPFAHVCLAISDLSKSLGFLNCKLEKGLFKASFGAVTETGRLASRQNAQGMGSNAQNVTPKLRHIFIAPPGEKFVVCDYAQIESRIVAAICFRLFGATNYLAMCECGDAHTLCSSMVWEDLPWPQDFTLDWTIKHGPFPKDMVKAAKELASVEFYRGKSRRDVSKTLGHGCLTSDHEVLTPSGWKNISDVCGTNQPILAWNHDTQESAYEIPLTWSLYDVDNLIEINGRHISLNMSPEHRIPVHLGRNGLAGAKVITVAKQIGKFLGSIPNISIYTGGHIVYSSDTVRLHAAFQADGSIHTHGAVVFNFKKKAKIDRLIKLLGKRKYSQYDRSDGATTIYIPREYCDFILNGKTAGQYILDWTQNTIKHYVDELPYWDGSVSKKHGTRITSMCKEHINWLYLAVKLVGKQGVVNYSSLPDGRPYYVLSIANHKTISIDRLSIIQHTQSTTVYCPTMPSGGFIVRRNGIISLSLNSNYMGRPNTMSKHSHIEIKLIEHYQSVYFAACPELLKWHRWVAEQVQTVGEITTMLGRTRRFFGRPNDDATIREAVAYEPQSVAADYCNRALLRLHNMGSKFPAVIRLSKHDELVVSGKEENEGLILDIMREQMEERITLVAPNGTRREWFVPAEAESGWNLGRKSDSNPNGIGHPLDGRVRVAGVGWKEWRL